MHHRIFVSSPVISIVSPSSVSVILPCIWKLYFLLHRNFYETITDLEPIPQVTDEDDSANESN
ncbi:hypothetical protein AHAS_Ahas10G0118400 [Arachis hypogaea]